MSDYSAFCPDEFWDEQLSVNTTSPDLTKCFQDTVLTWVPCFFLYLLCPIYFYKLHKSTRGHIQHTWLNVTQTSVSVVLAGVSAAEMGYRLWQHQQGYPVHAATILAPACRFIAMVICVALTQFGRKKGQRSCGLLFLHWLLQFIASAILLYSRVRHVVIEGYTADHLLMAVAVVTVALCLVQLILAGFVDQPSQFSDSKLDPNMCPEQHAGFPARVTFWWLLPLVLRGYRGPLTRADLWSLNPADTSDHVVPHFHTQWQKQLDKAQKTQKERAQEEYERKHCNGIEEVEVPLKTMTSNDPISGVKIAPGSKAPAAPQPRLAVALLRTFGPMYLMGSAFKLIHDCLMFISPMLLRALIQYTWDESVASWRGYAYAVLMFAVAFTQTLVLHQYFHRCFVTGMRIRTSIIAAVYEKSLKLSNAARRLSTVGEVVNLMSVDAQRFMELVTYLNMIWSAPFQMCVSLYFLWDLLGPSVLAGVAVMILVIPINIIIAKKNKTLQMAQMKHKDSRIKLMNEVLNGIKVLKLYAWELSFKEKVLAIRNIELDTLKKSAYLHAASSFAWSVTPFMVSLVTFAVYVMSSPDNVLDAEKAFVSLSLFNILRFPLSMLPMLIANIVQAKVSLSRLQKFLVHEELDPDSVQLLDKSDYAISVNHGSFSWEKNPEELKHTLNDINVEIPDGQLVAVVGQVGSGKSSLLSAMLGEMEKESGGVKVKGSVAYVAQQAWIQNATLRDNILFNNALDESKMAAILDACALRPDLDILPGREMTEIGEKGINLSGGQKARVSLARAVYSDADIYLLDDPLSAVDPHVGKHIFDNVLGPNGLLSKKTRVLVTHGLSYLPQCDQIFVLVDGRISEVGTYTELLAQSGNFADILKTYLKEEHDEEALEELETEAKEAIEELESHGNLKRIRRDTNTSTASGSLTGRRSLMSSSGSLAPADQELQRVKKAIAEQEKREAESKLIEAERAETGRVKLSVLRSYLSAMGAWVTVVIVLLFTLNNACSIAANFWLSAWADDVSGGRRNGTGAGVGGNNNNSSSNDSSSVGIIPVAVDTAQRDLRLGVYGALGFAQSVCIYLGAFALVVGCTRATGLLHSHLLHAVLRAPMAFFDTTPTGRVVNRFSKDTDVIDTLIPRNLEAWFKCTFHVVGTLLVICYSTPYFLVVAAPLGLFYYFVQRFYVATSRQLKRIESVSRSPIYSHFGETIQGAVTIRAYRQQQRFMAQSRTKVDENQVAYYPSIVSNRWLAVHLEFVGQFIVFFSALFAVIGRDSLTAGVVGLSISYALNITQTLNWMVRMTSELETNIVAVERVKEYSELPSEAAWDVPDKKPPALWPEEGKVDMESYSTRYREGMDLVLKGVSAHIEGGEKIGIVGRTGAGKSSLTMALFRIIEAAEGSISIDGRGIGELGLHDLRSKLTIIPQEPVLFSGSLRMNLDPFERHSDEQLWSALEHAHLRSFVAATTQHLEYECTEGGDNLSVGQRQLVCLARALLRKTRILILDEATAAVDMETDDLIQATIRKEFVDSTVLTIAHRLNTIMDYNRILVLDQGKVAEFDSPKALLNKKGLFYSMAKDAGLAD